MKETSDQWVVRLTSDQVKGPYSTEALRNMIISGAFNGNEEVCPYPQGEWQVLTKQAEFYDALLESLENPTDYDNKKTQKMEAETIVRVSPPPINKETPQLEPPKEIPKFDLKEFVENQIKADADLKERLEGAKKADKKNLSITSLANSIETAQKKAVAVRAQNQVAPISQKSLAVTNNVQPPDIQLTDIKKLKQKEAKKMIPFIIVIILLLGAAGYLFLIDDSFMQKENSGWTLRAPSKIPGAAVTEQMAQNYKRQALSALQSAQYEDLLLAQEGLIKIVESSDRDLEAYGLLCVTYEQLWPFTRQTDLDLKSILTTMQMARTINPISNFSDTCQAIYLLTKGQAKEAKSLVEKTLDNRTEEKFSLDTFLYFIKAEMLEYETNFTNAVAYYEQASKLWPQWSTAHFGLARMHYKLNKFTEARQEYEIILKDYPNSKSALYGLALVELALTKNEDKAATYFANGFKSKQKIQKDFHAQALLAYTKILVDKKDNKLALEVAQEGYRVSPSNRDLKELVISLGGEEKTEGANSEIVLVGDQFARAGDHLTAQAQYKTAFELNPKNGLAAYKAAKSLWLINQTRDAVIWLEKSIKANPLLLQAYVLKADYESQRYNFTAANKTLALANTKFPQSHEVNKALAQLEFRKNNMYLAIQYGERSIRVYDADAELLTLLAEAHMFIFLNGPSTRNEDQERKNQAKASAKQYAGRAIDLEPAWPEAQITFAKVLAAIDGAVRGETYLKELIKTFPYTIEYRIALADYYRQYEKFSESAKVYEEVLSIDSKSKKAAFGLAEAYRVLNKTDLAQKYYNITSSLDPSDVEAMFANAKLLIETASGREVIAKNEQALAKLDLVKKINPEFPKVSFYMARCYLELGNYKKAIEMIAEEKQRNPSIADSYILGAEIYYRQAQFNECAIEYSAAIKLRPSTAELYVKASICYRNSNSADIAEDMLAMALEREDGYPETHREYGYIYLSKRQSKLALDSFNKYLALSPNAPDRDAISAQIKRLGGGP